MQLKILNLFKILFLIKSCKKVNNNIIIKEIYIIWNYNIIDIAKVYWKLSCYIADIFLTKSLTYRDD